MALEHRIVLIIEQSHETEDIVVVVEHYSCSNISLEIILYYKRIE